MSQYTTRPLSDRTWLRPDDARASSQFTTSWSDTLDLLIREVFALQTNDLPDPVIEVDVRERDIRIDGGLRSDARATTPAVVVAFESKHGPLIYRSDRYRGGPYNSRMLPWQHNVRAIALTLEALRAVDRAGTRRASRLERRRRTMNAPVPLVFLSIKTTSQLPSRRAWEVAVVRREPDCTERELSMFVEDLDLAHADLAVLGSSGFYARHPRYRPGGPLESHGGGGFHPHPYLWQSHKVATKVEEWTRGAYLVGAAVSLHAEVLANMLRNYRLAPAWQFRTVDIEALAVGALASGYDVAGPLALAPPWPPLDTLSGLLSVRVPRDGERGTALGDARWAVRIYDAVMGSAGVAVEADTLTEVAEANGARAAERGEFAWP